jgi:alpha-1,2-mannosyltransferase
MSFTKTRLLLLAVTIAASGLIFGALSGHSRFTNDTGGTDFNVFYLAGQTVLEGNASELYSVYTERGPAYTYIYLPMFAVLMAPVASLPIASASVVWNLLSLAMIFHSALILGGGCFPAAGKDGSDASLKRPFVIYLLAAPVIFFAENLLLGQVHILLMYLIVLAWKYQRTRMEWTTGFLVGAAAVLKLLPAVFGLYFLLTRQYRALASMLVGCAPKI